MTNNYNYIPKHVSSSPVTEDYIFTDPNNIFMDLFKNEFDTTWMRNTEQKTFSIIEPEKETIDDGLVIYNYNKQKFRSDDFTNVHNGKHILFSGCSETEGVGGNIEDAWSKVLYDLLSKEEKCSGFFNLSRSGWGWSRIITNALVYFKKYGYPDTYFIMLPNHQRKFLYSSHGHPWAYWQKYPKVYMMKNPDKANDPDFATEPKEHLEDFVYFLISWKIFSELCVQKNINLIFSSWDSIDKESISRLEGFDNFVNIQNNKIEDYAKTYYKDHEIKKDDYSKRDHHAGRILHHFWADEFYKKYQQLGK
jgi:hypothetical protein